MPIPELVDYVRTQTQEGVSAEDVRVALLEAGWQEFDIENALHDVAAGLHPATPGASIHEDLAQVRGMVAHLATRLKTVEARLASLASLPSQPLLPSEFIPADHELSSGSRHPALARVFSVFLVLLAAVALGIYATGLVERNALAPRDHIMIAAALGGFLIVAAVVAMRRRSGWMATLLSAAGLMLWAMDTYIAWNVYHLMAWTVALALALLFVVIALVMGRWIVRLSR